MSFKKRQSLDSGLVESSSSNSHSNSAVKAFFGSYMPKLELAVQNNIPEELDDPTIDLSKYLSNDEPHKENLISPIKRNNKKRFVRASNETGSSLLATPASKRDPSFEELQFLIGVFASKKDYGNKLADIMLQGLEKALTPEIFQIFLKDRIPTNWVPIIKMNNDNTPYVEFLVKSQISDESPDSQLTDYSMDHITFGESVLMHLRERANFKSILEKPTTNSGTYAHIPSEQRCSTPVKSVSTAVKRRIPKFAPEAHDLNDSKRVLPSRNCKVSVPHMYRDTRPVRKTNTTIG